ncbi:hypothetical protein ACFL2Q_06455 [Thermodesulfobacteriota bacterium]
MFRFDRAFFQALGIPGVFGSLTGFAGIILNLTYYHIIGSFRKLPSDLFANKTEPLGKDKLFRNGYRSDHYKDPTGMRPKRTRDGAFESHCFGAHAWEIVER